MIQPQTWCLSYYTGAELVVNQAGTPNGLWFWLVWRCGREVCIKMLCDFGTGAVEAYGPLERLAIWAKNSRMRFNWKLLTNTSGDKQAETHMVNGKQGSRAAGTMRVWRKWTLHHKDIAKKRWEQTCRNHLGRGPKGLIQPRPKKKKPLCGWSSGSAIPFLLWVSVF